MLVVNYVRDPVVFGQVVGIFAKLPLVDQVQMCKYADPNGTTFPMLVISLVGDSTVLKQFFDAFAKFDPADQVRMCKYADPNGTTFPMLVINYVKDVPVLRQFVDTVASFSKADQMEILCATIIKPRSCTLTTCVIVNIKDLATLNQFFDIVGNLPIGTRNYIFSRLSHDYMRSALDTPEYGALLGKIDSMIPRFVLPEKFSQLPSDQQTDELPHATHTLLSKLGNIQARRDSEDFDPMFDSIFQWLNDQEPFRSLESLEKVSASLDASFDRIKSFYAASRALEDTLKSRQIHNVFRPVANRGLEALDQLNKWLAAQKPYPSTEVIEKAAAGVIGFQDHTTSCNDAFQTGLEEFEMNFRLLQMGGDMPLGGKVAIMGDLWLAGIRKCVLAQLGEMAKRTHTYHGEILEVGLLLNNLHEMAKGEADPGMLFSACASGRLRSFNGMLKRLPARDIQGSPLFKPFPSLSALVNYYRSHPKYGVKLARLMSVCYGSPEGTSVDYGEIEPVAVLMLHAIEKAKGDDNPLVTNEMLQEGP
jgi:hypothetical protein